MLFLTTLFIVLLCFMYAQQVFLLIITVDFFKNQQGWSLTDFKLFELLVYYLNFYV